MKIGYFATSNEKISKRQSPLVGTPAAVATNANGTDVVVLQSPTEDSLNQLLGKVGMNSNATALQNPCNAKIVQGKPWTLGLTADLQANGNELWCANNTSVNAPFVKCLSNMMEYGQPTPPGQQTDWAAVGALAGCLGAVALVGIARVAFVHMRQRQMAPLELELGVR